MYVRTLVNMPALYMKAMMSNSGKMAAVQLRKVSIRYEG